MSVQLLPKVSTFGLQHLTDQLLGVFDKAMEVSVADNQGAQFIGLQSAHNMATSSWQATGRQTSKKPHGYVSVPSATIFCS